MLTHRLFVRIATCGQRNWTFNSFNDVGHRDRRCGTGKRDTAARAAGRLLLEDEQIFIALPKSPLWWGEEKVIIDGPV